MDFKIAFAGTLIVGGAVGLMLPSEGPLVDSDTASHAQPTSQNSFTPEQQVNLAQSAASTSTVGWSDDVILAREGDGHFYANVRVEGFDYRMLVDTGASVVALTGEDALAMGLQWNEEEVRHVAQGASGPVNGVNVMIERMSIGGLEANNVRAIIIPEGAGISLLGQSFLSTVGTVEIAGDEMVLGS